MRAILPRLAVIAAIAAIAGWTSAALPAGNTAGMAPPVGHAQPDSKQIEKDLQRLPWPQFKSVIEAIPKLKADVDAYGPLGWQYLKTNYKTHAWQKNIDRLDATQRKQLIALIRTTQGANR